MVLLKNNGVLPLGPAVKKIAVVGPLADEIRVLEGNYNGTPSRATTALDGIRKQFRGAEVTFEPGTNFLRSPRPVPSSALTTETASAALKAEFFSGTEFKGAPVATRVDATVNFDFSTSHDAAPKGIGQFSVRWTGWLTPPESGT